MIQARTGSTRLPRKMILPFYENEGIFSLLLKKLTSAFDKNDIILATSKNPNNDILVEIAERYEVNYYRGSENDVLQRFIDAAKEFEAENIIRVCADNPFLDVFYIELLVEKFEKFNCDYLSYITSDGTPSIKTHYGFWAEAVKLSALEKVRELTNENLYHEHVTNFIYANRDIFDVNFFEIIPQIDKHKDIRLTIDTQVDFDIQKEIFNKLNNNIPNFTSLNVIDFLEDNPHYLDIMRNEILKNQK
ncbi:MAG: glycosyl transferase family 2 [Bacteroidales bacterium]|nr:glycosyl transferase family 2 [Bacteroidales bacterium]